MWRAIKRILITLNLMAEQSTETVAINEAQVEAGIRAQKDKAAKANYANGQLAGQIRLLKDQVKRGEQKCEEVKGLLQACANANDEANGAHYAEAFSAAQDDLKENQTQLEELQKAYEENTQIIANSIREIQKFQNDFERVKAKVATSQATKGLATLMQSSLTELQGMGSTEMGKSMEQLRKTAAEGMGQMDATFNLATALGSDIKRQQEMRAARGKLLFDQFKASANKVNAEATATPATPAPERQKVAA
jgi:predicted  nucleic acid-binding Zn-ribbon protein